MKIKAEVYNRLIKQFEEYPHETGGILGGNNDIVCEYELDVGRCTECPCSYVPNVQAMNDTIAIWQSRGIEFMGIYHTHFGSGSLSSSDKEYIFKILDAMPISITHLYFPLIVGTTKEIVAFIADRDFDKWNIRNDAVIVVETD